MRPWSLVGEDETETKNCVHSNSKTKTKMFNMEAFTTYINTSLQYNNAPDSYNKYKHSNCSNKMNICYSLCACGKSKSRVHQDKGKCVLAHVVQENVRGRDSSGQHHQMNIS